MVRCVGFSIVARANVRGNAPQQALVALDVAEIMSTFTRKETIIGRTHQPEILLFYELSLFFTGEHVPVLGEVFVNLLVHLLWLTSRNTRKTGHNPNYEHPNRRSKGGTHEARSLFLGQLPIPILRPQYRVVLCDEIVENLLVNRPLPLGRS